MVSIPNLTQYSLRYAFKDVKQLTIKDASMLEQYNEFVSFHRSVAEKRQSELKKKEEEERRKKKEEEEKRKREEEERKRVEEEKRRVEEELRERKENGIVLNTEELNALPVNAKSITVKKCDDYQNEVLDLSRFAGLEELTIGDGCFNYVSKVSVMGLKKLKSVAIGAKSFQNESNDSELVVSDCPELVSLSVGNESFKGFKEMKLSEVKALKTITIGDECLKDCDLVLRDLKSVESVVIGVNSFEKSRHSVVESASDSQRSEE